MKIYVVWYGPLMVTVIVPRLSMHVVMMTLKAVDVKRIVGYDGYTHEGVP